jgi:NADH-quinone oxidoreductase subunit A
MLYSHIYCLAYQILIITLVIGLLLILLLIIITSLLSSPKKDIEKLSAYECGFHPFQISRLPVDVHFYLIGILFLIFDMEIIFIYPWFTVAYLAGWSGLLYFVFFLFILIFGFIYEYTINVITWNK